MQAAIRSAIYPQVEQIRSTRAITIKLSLFPPGTDLGQVMSCLQEVVNPLYLNKVQRLTIANNGLAVFPEEIFTLGRLLTYLDLSHNNIANLPTDLAGHLPKLDTLILNDNNVSEIPRGTWLSGGTIKSLLIAGNRLTKIPHEISEMESLEVLDVDDNPLTGQYLDLIRSCKDIHELKSGLRSFGNQMDQNGWAASQAPRLEAPSFSRSRSMSDTRMLKASKRLGLIIRGTDMSNADDTTDGLSNGTKALALRDLPKDGTSDVKYEWPTMRNREIPQSSEAMAGTSIISDYRFRANSLREIDEALRRESLDSDITQSGYATRLMTLQEGPPGHDRDHSPDKKRDRTKPGSSDINLKKYAPKRVESSSNVSDTLGKHNSYTADRPDAATLLKVSKKVLFSLSELHLSVRRFSGFCSDKLAASKISSELQSTKVEIDKLVGTIEAIEDDPEYDGSILTTIHKCIGSFKSITLTLREYSGLIIGRVDACYIRMVYLNLYGSLNELSNAFRLLSSATTGKSNNKSIQELRNKFNASEEAGLSSSKLNTSNLDLAPNTEDTEESLYQSVDTATEDAKTVYGELMKALTRANTSSSPGSQLQNSHVNGRMKELANLCATSVDVTMRLRRKLASVRVSPTTAIKRGIFDDINEFLRLILQTFTSVKLIMKDAPTLNDARKSMANLTKSTKELTLNLEKSSFRSMPDLILSVLAQSSTPSTGSTNYQGHMAASLANVATPVRTPLEATMGAAAAQAILPTADSLQPLNSVTHSVSLSFIERPVSASDIFATEDTEK